MQYLPSKHKYDKTIRKYIKDRHSNKNYNIDEVGIEELFFNKNVKTAITVAQARGVICWHVRTTTNQFMNIPPSS